MLLALALGLWAWRAILTRPSAAGGLAAMIGAGLLAGLAILAKFNGIIALVCFAAWCLLGLALSGIASERKLILALGTVMAGSSAWFVFVELNPSMTAYPAGRIPVRLHHLADMSPWERFLFLVEYRRDMAREPAADVPPQRPHDSCRSSLRGLRPGIRPVRSARPQQVGLDPSV